MLKRLLFVLLLFGAAYQLQAQQKIVVGKVMDENGNPVPYATITLKGTTSGVSADAAGIYRINATAGTVLVISAQNMETAEFTVGNNTEINARLKPLGQLAEIVVTGVGNATTRKKIAIDIGTLNSKEIAKSAVGSVEQALQGKIAGATVQFNSGLPGTAAQIVLRGVNDLAGTGPMILVDGVEVSGGLMGLDLSAVERVEVVKGAAAGTLYGAQGANGVIQIFTKRGGYGRKPSISLRTQLSFDEIIHLNDLTAKRHHFETDAQGYITRGNSRITPDEFGAWPDAVFADVSQPNNNSIKNDKPYREPIFDHVKQAYRKVMTSNTSLNISGGGERSDYAFGASYLDQPNVLFNGFKRINLSANLGLELAKNFTFRTTTQFIMTDEDLLAGQNRFELTNSWLYIDFNHRDRLGNLVVNHKTNENSLNPLAEREWREREQKQNRLVQNFNLNYKLTRFVELDYKFGAEIFNTDFSDYYKNQRAALQSNIAFFGPHVAGSVRNQFNKFQFYNSLASVYVRTDFQRDFGSKLPVRTVTQLSYDWRNTTNRQYFAQGLILPNYPPYNISVAQVKTSGDFSDEFTTFGFLVNQTIEFGELFGVSAGVRSDYSSEFGKAKKPFTFPRATGYFRASELLKSQYIVDWKLRAAYGEAGIQPSRYARQITLDVNTIGIGGVGLSTPIQASNAELKVQRSKELEIGTDAVIKTHFGAWFSNINVSATWWSRKSVDVIQSADLPPSTGYQNVLDNLSSLSGRGIDLSLDFRAYESNNLNWNLGIRYGQFKVHVDKIANGKAIVTGIFGLQEGQDLGIIYAQRPVSSLDQLKRDKTTPYIDPGDRNNYEVVNGMVVHKTTKRVLMTGADDQAVLGSAFPKFNASFINTISWKGNLVLAFQWDWRYGNKIYNITRQWLYRDRLSKDYDKEVTINGETGAFINFYNSLYNNVSPSGWFVENGSFLRLRDLSLTYNINDEWRPKWVKQLGITLSGRNLVTFTSYGGLDPESTNISDAQGNPASGLGAINGVDRFTVPNLKSYQISLQVGF